MGEGESVFVAEVGASAALAGLVFVGVSINLDKVLHAPGLPGRAGEALIVLLAVLIVSSLLLGPAQGLTLIGLELVVVGLADWAAVVAIIRRQRAEGVGAAASASVRAPDRPRSAGNDPVRACGGRGAPLGR